MPKTKRPARPKRAYRQCLIVELSEPLKADLDHLVSLASAERGTEVTKSDVIRGLIRAAKKNSENPQ